MALILSSESGVAIAINDPTVIPITFTLSNWGGYYVRKALLQGISISSQGNFQFMYTLRNFIYVYIFGERMGDITITGMTVMSDCNVGGYSGISGTLGYYASNCATWTGMPVGIQIGFAGFYAFLTGITVGISDPKSGLGQFTMHFKTVP